MTSSNPPSRALVPATPPAGGALQRRSAPGTALIAQESRVLHQFPVSHYCEKTRWHLDRKGLAYTVRNLFPGRHRRINRRLAGHTSVPLLIDGGRVVHDSSAIALYLEETYPQAPLLPTDDGLRALALALENHFDVAVGPAVRQWCYGQLLRQRGAATKLFFASYGRGTRFVARVASLLFERRLAAEFPPAPAALARAEQMVLEGLERLENVTERNSDHFLVGEALSLADITAAALLAPLVGPPGSPWAEAALTPAMLEMRERLRARPGGQWVLRRYAQDRALVASPLG